MMTEDEQDALVRRLADDALRPPPAPREELWARIRTAREASRVRPLRPGRWAVAIPVGIAALLLLAFGLGRWTAPQPPVRTPVAAPPGSGTAVRVMAADYLGHTEVFLTDFRAAVRSGRPDSAAPAEARRLLGTARLLLDSRAAEDVRLRALLEDLELVLAEISQLPAAPHADAKLITDGLDRRGMLSRLRSAVPAGGAPTPTQGVS